MSHKACLLTVSFTRRGTPGETQTHNFGPVLNEKSAANLAKTLNEMIEGLGWPAEADVQNVKYAYLLRDTEPRGREEDYYDTFRKAFRWAEQHLPRRRKKPGS